MFLTDLNGGGGGAVLLNIVICMYQVQSLVP